MEGLESNSFCLQKDLACHDTLGRMEYPLRGSLFSDTAAQYCLCSGIGLGLCQGNGNTTGSILSVSVVGLFSDGCV